MTAASSSQSKVPKTMAATCSSLPDKLWEFIFKFLNDGDKNHYLVPLSVVSKQFLSITNRLRFSITISKEIVPLLPFLFQRFPHLTSLRILCLSLAIDLDILLIQISAFPLELESLTLSNPSTIPAHGLQALSKKMKNLTSLTCRGIASIKKNDLFFIANCFPLLEELILIDRGYPRGFRLPDDDDVQLLTLPKLRKITLSRNIIGLQSINYLCKNCDLLQEVSVIEWAE